MSHHLLMNLTKKNGGDMLVFPEFWQKFRTVKKF